MATYVVQFERASHVQLFSGELEAETSKQALEFAKKALGEHTIETNYKFEGYFVARNEDWEISILELGTIEDGIPAVTPVVSWQDETLRMSVAAPKLAEAAEKVLAGQDGAMDELAKAVKLAREGRQS